MTKLAHSINCCRFLLARDSPLNHRSVLPQRRMLCTSLRRLASVAAAKAAPASPHIDDQPKAATQPADPSAASKRVLKSTNEDKAFDAPPADSEDRRFSPKILAIVDQISSLSLLEVADLNQALKKRLNIPDAPMMSYAAVATPAGSSGDRAEDEDSGPSVVTKTSFTVKLLKFEEGKKINIIKEIKSIMSDMNLVQAKKYVESLPQIVKADIGKDEAEKLKEKLQQLGGECEIV